MFCVKGLAMPIYAYRCSACGHAKDVLQKLSDPLLSNCPACGAEAFTKQLTAAGFQLKGSGWYATDFKNGQKTAPAAGKTGDAAPAAAEGQGEAKAESKGDSKGAPVGESQPAAAAPAAP
jgi:putative FmdB family regulatory protein